MFKFQTVISGLGKWNANLFLEDIQIGTVGLDEEGLFIGTDKHFTLKELNLLIAQLVNNNPEFMNKELEFIKLN